MKPCNAFRSSISKADRGIRSAQTKADTSVQAQIPKVSMNTGVERLDHSGKIQLMVNMAKGHRDGKSVENQIAFA